MTWQTVLQPVFESDFYKDLQQSVDREYAENKCFPPKENIFRALDLCDFHQVKVVVLGQDPYHDDLQANGLAFSVNNQVKTPPSLKNIYKELYQDLGIVRNQNELDDWAKQGILLLNSTLTVKAHAANSSSISNAVKRLNPFCCNNSKNTPSPQEGSKIFELLEISAISIIKSATILGVKYCPNLFFTFCLTATSIRFILTFYKITIIKFVILFFNLVFTPVLDKK
jgi:uracil DNA glycosylase